MHDLSCSSCNARINYRENWKEGWWVSGKIYCDNCSDGLDRVKVMPLALPIEEFNGLLSAQELSNFDNTTEFIYVIILRAIEVINREFNTKDYFISKAKKEADNGYQDNEPENR